MAHAPSSTRRWKSRSSWSSRPSSTSKNPQPIQSADVRSSASQARPAAASRSGSPPAKLPKLRAAIKKSGIPREGARPDGDVARRLIAAERPVPGHGPQGLERRRGDPSPAVHYRRTSRSASSRRNVEQFGFFDRLPESAQRAAARRRDRAEPQTSTKEFDGRCSAPGRAATSRRSRDTFNQELTASPELKRRCLSSATPIGPSGSSSAWLSPGRSWSRSARATSPARIRCIETAAEGRLQGPPPPIGRSRRKRPIHRKMFTFRGFR